MNLRGLDFAGVTTMAEQHEGVPIREALDLLAREQGCFDLLLTDIRMPIMDGIALALAAARKFPELTILLMPATPISASAPMVSTLSSTT